MKKLLLFLLIFSIVGFVCADEYNFGLTYSIADLRYCMQGRVCNLTNLTVINQTVVNINTTTITLNGTSIEDLFCKIDGSNCDSTFYPRYSNPTGFINWTIVNNGTLSDLFYPRYTNPTNFQNDTQVEALIAVDIVAYNSTLYQDVWSLSRNNVHIQDESMDGYGFNDTAYINGLYINKSGETIYMGDEGGIPEPYLYIQLYGGNFVIGNPSGQAVINHSFNVTGDINATGKICDSVGCIGTSTNYTHLSNFTNDKDFVNWTQVTNGTMLQSSQYNTTFNQTLTDNLYYPLNTNPNEYISNSTVASLTSLSLTTDLTVANGGTGASSFNARGVVLGGITTTGALQSLANSATASVYLRNVGSTSNPAWSTLVLPNACTLNTVTYCSGTNVLAQATGLTFNAVSTPIVLTVTGNTIAYGLTDSGVGHDDYLIDDTDGVFSIFNNVDSIRGLTIAGTGGISINAGADDTITFSEGNNFVFGQITGTEIGSTIKDKLAFWGNTPIVKPAGDISVNNILVTTGFWDGELSHTSFNITTNFTKNVIIQGNFSAKRPYWSGYDNSTQPFLNTANAQVINISNNLDIERWQITVLGMQNLTFEQTGVYLCILSPEFFQNSGGTALITFWIEKNGVDVPWSNSRYSVPNNAYNAPSIPFQFEITAPTTDIIRFKWWSDSTNSQIYSSGALTLPTRPSIPGTILNCQKVSEIP